jgi:methyl-accepting chemotaxis protein
MLRFFNNIPIFRRFLVLFTILAVVPIIVIALLSNFFLTSLNTRSQAVQTSVDAQSIASQEQGNLQRMHEELQTRFNQIFASLSGKVTDPALANAGGLVGADIAAREAEFGQTLQAYQANYDLTSSSNMATIRSILINDSPSTGPGIIADQQQALGVVVKTQWPAYENLLKQEVQELDRLDPTIKGHSATILPAALDVAFTHAYSTLWHASQAFTDLQNSWQRVVDDAATTGKTVTTVGTSETQPIIVGSSLAAVVIIALAFLIGLAISFTVVNPLRSLAALTRRIARGDTNARAKMKGRDEIALVATSMNNMLDNIVRLIQETQGQRDLLQRQVEKLVSEVSGVGEGDLRVQAEVTADALGVLADSFNYMVEELGSLVVRVKMVANEVDRSTSAIFDRLTQLVETGDIQLNQIANSAIQVEHMADSSRQVADRAEILYGVARDARQSAQGGRASVQQAVEGMGRIHENVQETSSKVQVLGERSREINNIVEVISSIAHQTNRLALDAAIQAAMAGENGKGFGAVAADIRRLAERAKEQASMIGRIVRDVRDDIGAVAVSMQDTERETSAGSELTQEAGIALESIFSAVEHQAREIENINQMAAQQLQSSRNVVQIMRAISNTTQQSTMSTRTASQEMERLARLVEQLRSSVEAFKLRENQGYYVPPSSNVTVTQVDGQDNHMSMSGIFRTVTASTQKDSGAANYPALAPAGARPAQQYPPVSYPPNQIQPPAAYRQWPGQQNGAPNYPPQQQWPAASGNGAPALPPQQQWPPRQPRTQRPYPANVPDNGNNGR